MARSINMSLFKIFSLLFCLHLGGGVLAASNRIVNGTDAYESEFPFIASLRRSNTGSHSCGASILNPMWILTAAHCVSKRMPENINIQYGVTVINATGPNVVNVSKIVVHPGYSPPNRFIHDIALLRVQEPMILSETVQTVKLPNIFQHTPGDSEAILIGWGLNATDGDLQNHLQKVDLKIFSKEECSVRHNHMTHLTNICAGVEEGGKGQCSGDSGGPLIVNGTQVGIVSWSRKPCTIAPYPGVFTEVSAYIDWIMDTMEKDIDASFWNDAAP